MAEDEPTTASTEPASAEAATPEGDAATTEKNGEGGANGNPSNGKRPHKKEELVPIEELFDLSKPIPKVGEPTRNFCY